MSYKSSPKRYSENPFNIGESEKEWGYSTIQIEKVSSKKRSSKSLSKYEFHNRHVQIKSVNLYKKYRQKRESERDIFINKIVAFDNKGDKNEAVELVYNYFGKLIIERKYFECNEILQEINDSNLSSWLIMPFLTLSKPYKSEIPNRSDLFNNAVIKFLENETMTKDQVLSSINRLK